MPQHHQGIPVDALGRWDIDLSEARALDLNGLPIDDDGQVVVQLAAPARISNGWPLTASGKLAISTSAPVETRNGLPIAANGALCVTQTAGPAEGGRPMSVGKVAVSKLFANLHMNPNLELNAGGWGQYQGASSDVSVTSAGRITTDARRGTGCFELTVTTGIVAPATMNPQCINGGGLVNLSDAATLLRVSDIGGVGAKIHAYASVKVSAAPTAATNAGVEIAIHNDSGAYISLLPAAANETGLPRLVSNPVVDVWNDTGGTFVVPATLAGQTIQDNWRVRLLGQATFASPAINSTYGVRADCTLIGFAATGFVDGTDAGYGWEGTAHQSRTIYA